jgi:hypothetical protein
LAVAIGECPLPLSPEGVVVRAEPVEDVDEVIVVSAQGMRWSFSSRSRLPQPLGGAGGVAIPARCPARRWVVAGITAVTGQPTQWIVAQGSVP